jgi:P-type Cu2+ transporter
MSVVDAPSRSSTAAASGEDCFHCGLPLPPGNRYSITIDGGLHPLCCAGCQAVAQTIVEHGLTDYYRHRTSRARPREAVPRLLEELRRFDLPQVQKGFTRGMGAHEREAALLLEGMVCAACVWLVERDLARLPGVLGVQVNYATQRASVRWDERKIALSAILAAVAAVGYRAWPYDAARFESARRRERGALLRRMLIAGLGMMQVMMYALPGYVTQGELSGDAAQLMRFASLVLTIPVVFYSATPFFLGAWRDLAARRLGMDVPVALGIGVAFVASAAATLFNDGVVYFDSIAMFVFLLLAVRFLEASARGKAAAAYERLLKLVPAVADRVRNWPGDGTVEEIAVASLQRGDCIRVAPGMGIAADGCVVDGASEVNEALLTGEARPIGKRPGDDVTAGAVNVSGPLIVRVERVGAETTLAGIMRLLERAAAEKPAIAQLADRIARVFVAALVGFAAAVAVAWWIIDPARALGVAVAVLVVSCPCALSLATPAAVTAAIGALHASGVLVTRGHALETLAAATDFIFDKTGTVTEGGMRCERVVRLADLEESKCLELAGRIETASGHPIGRALATAAGPVHAPVAPGELRPVAGAGIEARVDGVTYRLGSMDFVAGLNQLPAPAHDCFGEDVIVVALGDAARWLALFVLADPLRADAVQVVRDLQDIGKRVHLVSGDSGERVARVGNRLGVDAARGGAKPEDKLRYVQQLQQQGAIVAMIGDGINDAASLACAQVSAAMASGADIAQTSADMVLPRARLHALLDALRIACSMLRIVRQNLWWAFGYNIVMVPLAALGLVTPLIAGAGMALSSFVVVLNALRLVRPVETLNQTGDHAA